jgi:hypothetical protein
MAVAAMSNEEYGVRVASANMASQIDALVGGHPAAIGGGATKAPRDTRGWLRDHVSSRVDAANKDSTLQKHGVLPAWYQVEAAATGAALQVVQASSHAGAMVGVAGLAQAQMAAFVPGNDPAAASRTVNEMLRNASGKEVLRAMGATTAETAALVMRDPLRLVVAQADTVEVMAAKLQQCVEVCSKKEAEMKLALSSAIDEYVTSKHKLENRFWRLVAWQSMGDAAGVEATKYKAEQVAQAERQIMARKAMGAVLAAPEEVLHDVLEAAMTPPSKVRRLE